MHKYAREAYNTGIRFIGGCCGFEPYHIRALAEELAPERGFLPVGSEKHGNWGAGLEMHTKPWVRARSEGTSVQNYATFMENSAKIFNLFGINCPECDVFSCIFILFRARRDYWETLKPASGRPLCPSMSTPDCWGVTKGDTELMQQKEATTKEQLKQLFDRTKSH